MVKRWIENDVKSAMAARRGVFLTGARQSGKTTLASMLKFANVKRLTLDNAGVCVSAQTDPITFVERRADQTMVIDEVQKAPGLLDAIKIRLDEDQSKGQYLLTGSSNLRFIKAVRDSLAGRLATIRLRTLTLAELNGHAPDFLDRAFRGEFEAGAESMGKRDVIRRAFVGGYPEQLDFRESERRRWFRGYLEDLLTKDVKDVTEIRKIDVLKEVAVWLMAHSSQYFVVDDLCTRAGISKQTAENYMEALRALYVFDKVPAWSKSDYDRIGKRAKWIVSDTGLMANILKWNEDAVFEESAQNGKLVESWVYHELAVQADVLGGYEISQYRDKDKREIDFLVENNDGALLGVEVKAGALVGEDDFKHMKWFAKNLAKTSFTGIVLYTGKEILPFGKGFHAVPMSCLS